jgi:hypothetical protein
MNIVIKHKFIIPLLLGALSFSACKSFIPESIDALGDDVNYMVKEYTPTLGRKTIYENAANVSNTSSLPLTFKLVNVRSVDGSPASELTDKFPVKVWKENYTGEETSIAEIESKREIEYHSIFEVSEKSGNILFWDYGNSNWIKTQPDSCYIFDVEISNSGGRKYARNLRLKPFKERPYQPSQYNVESGLATRAALSPSYIYNLEGEETGDFIFDVEVFVFKDIENTAPGGTLSISVLDSMNNTIDIRKFKDTNWKTMIHGFNHRFEGDKAVYDVAYPIPLVQYPTKYTTTDGNLARINLRYNRLGFGGFLSQSQLGFDFAIYEEGHWEIQFRFRGETPKFDND